MGPPKPGLWITRSQPDAAAGDGVELLEVELEPFEVVDEELGLSVELDLSDELEDSEVLLSALFSEPLDLLFAASRLSLR